MPVGPSVPRQDLRLVLPVVVVWIVLAGPGIPGAVRVCAVLTPVVLACVFALSALRARSRRRRHERGRRGGRATPPPRSSRAWSAHRWLACDILVLTVLAACVAVLRRSSVHRASEGPGSAVAAFWPDPVGSGAAALRSGFLAVVSTLPGRGPGLIAGMSVGETGAIRDDLSEAMNAASLGHLTAVSGANCIVATWLGVGAGALLGAGRRGRLLAGAAALVGFVLLVGPQPSVLRAAGMLSLVLVARFIGLKAGGVSVLAAAVLVLVLCAPTLATDIGFGMSVSATAGLIVFAPALGDGLSRFLPSWLSAAIAVPVAAQLACLPWLLLLGSGASLGAIVANLCVAPVSAIVTVVGLLACLSAAVPPLATALSLIAWPFTEWTALVARFFAANPLGPVPWPSGGVGVASAAVLAIAAAAAVLSPAGRAGIAMVAIGAAVAVSGGVAGVRLGVDASLPSEWAMVACDVGQGDGLVFRDGGDVLVVDVGRYAAPMLDCLERLGVSRISALIVTHWDADHAGAAAEVATALGPASVFSGRSAPGTPDFDAVEAAGFEVEQIVAGEVVRAGAVTASILSPQPGSRGNDNQASVVALVRAGGVTTLALADVDEGVQLGLLGAIPQGVDVLKMAHHGSADFSAALTRRVAAPLAVVSVGAGNPYGHPRAEAIDAAGRAGSVVARTDRDGRVVVFKRDGSLGLWCERGREQMTEPELD